jgi:two-component system sensor kinase FixL
MNDHLDKKKEVAILKGAVESTNEAFVTIDQNHCVIFFNEAAEKIFGYSRREVIGNDLNTIMSLGCSRDHRKAVDNYLQTRIPNRIGHASDMKATRKNGETFPANISFSVSKVNGELYFTGIVRDLTETKALQDRIIRSERLAALGHFVTEITHEIRNPLMMIGGFARQLIQRAQDEKTLKKLGIIVNEVSRLEELLKELRTFYLPKELIKKEIDIKSLLQEVYSLVKADSEKKKIRTELKTAKKPLVVQGDRDKIKQVFLNLAKNAIEAMENGGNMTIRGELSGDLVEISIADDGCGIPEDDENKIFSPFFTTKQHGTGLGLSISKSIIENHEGSSLTLKCEKGKGTICKVTMPLYERLT